ncbi:MAG TPA: imidazole glycerol phosphate synthase subunit HisH [Gemmatimonadaceae bacterium]|nr:imidazole glycerol phosphate synthase subunit HisH [Gemmatimonadaceae bacterium]
MKAAILDYGAGNLYSLSRAVKASGAEVLVTSDVDAALKCDVLLLPGVGAFGSASEFLAPRRDRIRAAVDDGLPCLGICLGMQLLFDESEEGEGGGLGIIEGRVRKLNAERVPQMGWNDLEDIRDAALRSANLSAAYFANSYVCEPDDRSLITSWATHEEDRFAASVRSDRVVGVQFHPEKSSLAGVSMIGAFLTEVSR